MIKRDDGWFKHDPIEVICPACEFRSAVTAGTKAWPDCPSCDNAMVRFEDEKAIVD